MSAVTATAPRARTDWRVLPLSQICVFKPPKSICRKQFGADAEVSFVPMNDLGELVKYFEPQDVRPFGEVVKNYTYFADGDVLCAKITPCFENGKLGVARGLKNGVGFGSSEFVVMRTSDELLPEFLYYFLSRDAFRVAGARIMSGAVGHKRVPKEYFENLLLPLPAVEEQKRIVAVLDQAFAALDRARANVQTNLADASELYEARLDSVFCADHSGWPDVALDEMFDIGSSKRVLKNQWKTAGVPFYRAREIVKLAKYGHVDNELYVAEDHFSELKRSHGVPQPGDLMVSAVGTLGACYAVQPGDRFYFKDASVLWFRPRRQVASRFFEYAFLSRNLLEQVKAGEGATVGTFTISRARMARVRVPPYAEQQRVVGMLDRFTAALDNVRTCSKMQIHDLAELRQSVLQKAFAGELT